MIHNSRLTAWPAGVGGDAVCVWLYVALVVERGSKGINPPRNFPMARDVGVTVPKEIKLIAAELLNEREWGE